MSELFGMFSGLGIGFILLFITYLTYKISFPYIQYINYRDMVKYARYKKQVDEEKLNVEECNWLHFFTKKEKRNQILNDFEKDKATVEGEKLK